MIKVGLVDDQQLVREGIAGLLSLSGKTEILWQAANGVEALEKICVAPVDILLADIRMPTMDGIELVQKLREQNIAVPILMLTTFDDSELFARSLAAGANGFLLKDVSLEKLIHSIEALVAGGFITDNTVLKKWQQEKSQPTVYLTDRELQILRLLVGGMSNKEIMHAVFLAEGTVRNHVSNILAKLECRDRTQAVLKALELGLV
ncbi:DNA-binding response regulator [Cellvibrio zantedeschiae]|uniref:DNA-binding response regulator n=1 Tax=Cellvibrio zantedeschiae TaxID=1237077 RepID=A0ABQ3ASA9_9GAMM|nr:response regulator transcription factor [Cellvibrio zantedeschiae]GGY66297.1 DNA-binding response regulator [Cellvibrio zantedeschiae]